MCRRIGQCDCPVFFNEPRDGRRRSAGIGREKA